MVKPFADPVMGLPQSPMVGPLHRCSEAGLSGATGRISSGHGIGHSLSGSDHGVNSPLTRDSCQPHGRVPYTVAGSNDHSVENSPLVRNSCPQDGRMLYANRDRQPGNVQSEGDAWTDLSNLGYRQTGSCEERALHGNGTAPISGVVAQSAYEDAWRLAGNGAFRQNLLATENGHWWLSSVLRQVVRNKTWRHQCVRMYILL